MTAKANLKKKRKKSRFSDITGGDVALCVFLAVLSGGSAYLPWHVYNNPNSYSPPKMVFSRDRAAQGDDLEVLASGFIVFDLLQERFVAAEFGEMPLDPITTASVSPQEAQTDAGQVISTTPEVSEKLSLVAADPRRALIADSDGIYLVRPSSRLPGGGKVRLLQETENGYQLITTGVQLVAPVDIGN